MAVDTDQLNALLARADDHQVKLIAALATLENRIVDLVATAPLKDGSLFDLEWAVQARVEIRQAIEEEYLSTVDALIREYSIVADDIAVMLGAYKDVARLDPDIVSQLQTLTFNGFDDIGKEYLDLISKEVYENTLTGTPFSVGVSNIRKAVGGDMARYSSQRLHDSLLQFDRTVNTRIALDAGATRFQYRGSSDEVTREFCRRHVDKIYTVDEINEIWQGEWSGKIDSNAFVSAGGYNCRHRFRPVFDD